MSFCSKTPVKKFTQDPNLVFIIFLQGCRVAGSLFTFSIPDWIISVPVEPLLQEAGRIRKSWQPNQQHCTAEGKGVVRKVNLVPNLMCLWCNRNSWFLLKLQGLLHQQFIVCCGGNDRNSRLHSNAPRRCSTHIKGCLWDGSSEYNSRNCKNANWKCCSLPGGLLHSRAFLQRKRHWRPFDQNQNIPQKWCSNSWTCSQPKNPHRKNRMELP